MEANSSVLNQILAAQEKSKVPALDPAYEKFFKDSKGLLEDIVLEQWEMNDYNKKNSKVFERIEFSLASIDQNLIPFIKDFPTPLEMSDQIVSSWKAIKNEEDLFGPEKPEVVKEKNNLGGDKLESLDEDILAELTLRGEDQYMQMDFLTSLVQNIDKNISALKNIDDYKKHFDERNKQGKSEGSGQFEKKPKKEDTGFLEGLVENLGLGELVAGALAVGAEVISGALIGGLIIAAVAAITSFWDGFSKKSAAELTGKNEADLTFWDRFNSGIVSVINTFTFGLFDKKAIYANLKKVYATVEGIWDTVLADFPKPLSDFLNNAVKWLNDGIENIFKVFTDDSKDFIDKILTLNKMISDTIYAVIEPIYEKIKELVTDFGNMILGWMGKLFTSITDLLPTSVKQIGADAYKAVEKAFTNGPSKQEFKEEDVPQVNSVPLSLDTSTSKQTQDLAIESKALERQSAKEKQPTVVPVPVPAKDSKNSGMSNTLSSGRDEGNRALNRGFQFSVI